MENTFSALGITEPWLLALDKGNFRKPMEIQGLAIPKVIDGTSLIAQAPTGTGKTLAYLLPILQGIDTELAHVQAVVLAPTYELSMQIARTARQLADDAGIPVRTLGLIGGANIARQVDSLKKKPHLIVGSAGRMMELFRKGKLKLQTVRVLVLDEFDRLLDDQNLSTVAGLVDVLPKTGMQYLLFSATAPKKAMERASFLPCPEVLRVKASPVMAGQREDYCVIVPFRKKLEMLRRLARSIPVKRGLVFVNKVFDAERTLEKLSYEGIRAASLLGRADKMTRKKALEDFAKGKVQILLSTDLAARGLDVPEIDYVVNLDLPDSSDIYLHRAGRTARAGLSGAVITLADSKEARKLEQLEERLGICIKPWKPKKSDEGKKPKRGDHLQGKQLAWKKGEGDRKRLRKEAGLK